MTEKSASNCIESDEPDLLVAFVHINTRAFRDSSDDSDSTPTKSLLSPGFYGQSTGPGSLGLVDSDCEIQRIESLGNLADGSLPMRNQNNRRGSTSIHTRLPGIPAMPGFFALRFFLARRSIGKLIARFFANAPSLVKLSKAGSTDGKPVVELCEHGCSLVKDQSRQQAGRSNPPSPLSQSCEGFSSSAAWDDSYPDIPDPVTGVLPSRQAVCTPVIFSNSSWLRDALMLVASGLLILVLAGSLGCRASRGGAESIQGAKDIAGGIDGTLDSIQYHAQQAKKELDR